MEEIKEDLYAISVRQPWAALIVAGIKSVEIRTWPTQKRGRVLIHAAKLIDERVYAWKWVVDENIKRLSELRGGIIGQVEIMNCIKYANSENFAIDHNQHLNDVSWFVPPQLYGFQMLKPKILTFTPLKGQTLFFSVKGFAQS